MELKRWSSNQVLEYWKDIQNYEGLYMVSSLGKVKSLNYRNTGKTRILKPRNTNKGYLRVSLHKNGKGKTFKVHRLVASAFIPNIEDKPCIDHINTIRTDNRVCNLRWCTQKENCNNSLTKKKLSEKKQGEKHPMARKVRCIETGEVFTTLTGAGKWCGTHRSSIAKQIQRKYKSAGKHPITNIPLHWEYVIEVELDLNLLNIDNINISL